MIVDGDDISNADEMVLKIKDTKLGAKINFSLRRDQVEELVKAELIFE